MCKPSASSKVVSSRLRTAALDTSLIFAPALLMTSYSALSIAFLTPVSSVLDPVTSSIDEGISTFASSSKSHYILPDISGSTRGVSLIRVPKALAARALRTSLEVSAKHFAKVRCSCGKNGFKKVGIFSRRLLRARRIAAGKDQLVLLIQVEEIAYL